MNSRNSKDNWFRGGTEMVSSGCNPLNAFSRNGNSYYRGSGTSRIWEIAYFGRAAINKNVVVPGYVVPSHGGSLL